MRRGRLREARRTTPAGRSPGQPTPRRSCLPATPDEPGVQPLGPLHAPSRRITKGLPSRTGRLTRAASHTGRRADDGRIVTPDASEEREPLAVDAPVQFLNLSHPGASIEPRERLLADDRPQRHDLRL